MSDLDPEIIDIAYRAHHVARRGGRDMVPGEYEATYSRVEAEWLTAALTAAAPHIERQVREQVAREIEGFVFSYMATPNVLWQAKRLLENYREQIVEAVRGGTS